jgi:hypothetical protein
VQDPVKRRVTDFAQEAGDAGPVGCYPSAVAVCGSASTAAAAFQKPARGYRVVAVALST